MLQQNRGAAKTVRVESIRPFYKVDRAGDGSLSREVIAVGDVIEVPADVAADLVSCGKAQRSDKQVGAAAKPAAAKAAKQ